MEARRAAGSHSLDARGLEGPVSEVKLTPPRAALGIDHAMGQEIDQLGKASPMYFMAAGQRQICVGLHQVQMPVEALPVRPAFGGGGWREIRVEELAVSAVHAVREIQLHEVEVLLAACKARPSLNAR